MAKLVFAFVLVVAMVALSQGSPILDLAEGAGQAATAIAGKAGGLLSLAGAGNAGLSIGGHLDASAAAKAQAQAQAQAEALARAQAGGFP